MTEGMKALTELRQAVEASKILDGARGRGMR